MEISEQSRPLLAEYGFVIADNVGSGNMIHFDRSTKNLNLIIDLNGKSGGLLLFGTGFPFGGRVRFGSDGCLFSSSGFVNQGGPSRVDVVISGPGAAIFGKGISSVSSQWIIEGSNRVLIVGDDCLISWQVECRNYDSHAIFDLDTQTVLNRPSDLIIGAHVWIGQKVCISKGVTVGSGTIIGMGSIVTADLPPNCAAAGVPARVIKEHVSWDRSWGPTHQRMIELRDYLDHPTA
jgi:carbonic anhydrase/acetyltransferase-like protein (isoleucine patch superfamily)